MTLSDLNDAISIGWVLLLMIIGAGGVWLTQARNSWRIQQLERDLTSHKDVTAAEQERIRAKAEKIEKRQGDNDLNIGVIKVSIEQMKEMLAKIMEKMEQKADK